MNQASHHPMAWAWLWSILIVACLQPSVVVAAAGVAPQDIHPPGWREFESNPGRFKILLPDTPTTFRQNIKTDLGIIPSIRFTAFDAANVTYDILFNDYPKAVVSRVNPHKLLDSARAGLLYQTKGKLVGEKPITVTGFPGRDQEIISGDGTHYRIRLVWVENRLYQIMAVTPGQPRPDAQKFFDSFQIIGRR